MGLLELFSEGKKYLKDAMPGGLLNQEWTPENVRTAAEVTSMIPNPVGDVASGFLAADDLRKGNYGDAALNGIGLLPFVPAMGGVVKGWHGTNDVIDSINLAHKGKNFPDYSLGFHFSGDKSEAKKYGDKLYEVSMDAKNPLVIHGDYATSAIDFDLAEIRHKLLEAIKRGKPYDAIHSYGKDGGFNGVALDQSIVKIIK